MTVSQIKNSISYCGLICCFCNVKADCDCKTNNHCCKRLSIEGCYQYECCRAKGLNGCWECADFPCNNDMYATGNFKPKVFARCIKEDGIDNFAQYIWRNHQNGVIYNTSAQGDDYGLDCEESLLKLIRTGCNLS